MIAGTVKGSSPNRSMSACSASSRCCPSIARGILVDGIEPQRLVARDDDRPRDGREIPRLAALLVILDELVDLPADDRPLIGLVARSDAALQEVPVDLRWRAALLATAADRL